MAIWFNFNNIYHLHLILRSTSHNGAEKPEIPFIIYENFLYETKHTD